MNSLKEKLKCGKIYGTLVCLSDPCLCEIMGNVGYDCIWVDLEHTYVSYKDVLCHLNAARSAGTSAIVRLPENDLTATKKILEMGPDGVIFPMVKSEDQFNTLMSMTLYPPLGTRGFGPMRAIGYDAANARKYVTEGNLDMARFVQVEDTRMINELEKIAKNPYIDGFIFGPNDLSASVGEFLNVFGDATVNEVKRAVEIIKRHGKYTGIACGYDKATLEFWSQFDFDMVFAGADWNFIFNEAKSALSVIKKANGTDIN